MDSKHSFAPEMTGTIVYLLAGCFFFFSLLRGTPFNTDSERASYNSSKESNEVSLQLSSVDDQGDIS